MGIPVTDRRSTSFRRTVARPFAAARPAVAAVLALAAAALLVAAPPASATAVNIFRTQSQRAFLAGNLEGIGVDPLGRLRLADRADRLTAIAEPFLLAAAVHPEGWVVGTGNAGRVLLVRRGGAVEVLFAASEPEVFAVHADPDGTVWAASSPDGRLYRLAPGADEAEVWYEPAETYAWAIERSAAGDLLVATGTQGRLHRVAGKGEGEVVYDSDDTHLRALTVLPEGEVMVGTAGEGLIQVLTPSRSGPWRVRTLYDHDAPEIVAFALAPDGTRYAAAVSSESSLVDLSGPPQSASSSGDEDDEEEDGEEGSDGSVVVTVTPSGPIGPSPPRAGRRSGSGPRSEILAITPAGVVSSLVELDDETVFDLLWHRGRLWVGTGLEGKLFAWNGSQLVLEKDVDERQVVALVPDEPGPAFATTNAAALFRVAGGTEREGTYTSAALDADQLARFGTFRWRGEVPRGGGLAFSFRTGISAEPDRTWSEWSAWSEAARGGSEGGEVGLGELPRGRYAQWRARFESGGGGGGGDSPLLYGVELTYRQENLRPQIERLDVLEPGEILVPANFNPGGQVFEPASPTRDRIFTTLEPSARDGDGRLKSLWKPGFRSLRWQAEDDNDDELVYRLSFRQAGDGAEDGAADGASAAAATDGWMEMADELEDTHYSFDSRVLPDGIYRFRLEATDRPDNPPGEALTAERLSEPVVVDHSPPRLGRVERVDADRLRVRVEDALSPLREVRVSVDAGEWRDLRPDDGLLDGRGESFTVEAPAGARLVLLQATDAAYNGATFDLAGSRNGS